MAAPSPAVSAALANPVAFVAALHRRRQSVACVDVDIVASAEAIAVEKQRSLVNAVNYAIGRDIRCSAAEAREGCEQVRLVDDVADHLSGRDDAWPPGHRRHAHVHLRGSRPCRHGRWFRSFLTGRCASSGHCRPSTPRACSRRCRVSSTHSSTCRSERQAERAIPAAPHHSWSTSSARAGRSPAPATRRQRTASLRPHSSG